MQSIGTLDTAGSDGRLSPPCASNISSWSGVRRNIQRALGQTICRLCPCALGCRSCDPQFSMRFVVFAARPPGAITTLRNSASRI